MSRAAQARQIGADAVGFLAVPALDTHPVTTLADLLRAAHAAAFFRAAAAACSRIGRSVRHAFATHPSTRQARFTEPTGGRP